MAKVLDWVLRLLDHPAAEPRLDSSTLLGRIIELRREALRLTDLGLNSASKRLAHDADELQVALDRETQRLLQVKRVSS